MKVKKPKTANAQVPKRIQAARLRPSSALNHKTSLLRGVISASAPFVAASGLTLAALELGLHILVPTSALRSHDLPVGARIFLLSYSLTVLNLFLILVAAFLKLIVHFVRPVVLPTRLRWIPGSLPTLFIGSALFFYAASWATYWQIGSFIDSRVLLFVAPHPVQVFHWVDRDAAFTVLTVAVVLTILIQRVIPRWLIGLQPSSQSVIVRSWFTVALVCLLGTLFGEVYSRWGERAFMRVAIGYRQSYDKATGPLPFVLTEIRRRLQGRTADAPATHGMEIVRRPIIPMPQYLATARPHDLNRWNVIILIVESLRADQLRLYGSARDAMPAVDALTEDSRVFLNTYTQSTHTDYATIVPFSSHYPLRSTRPYTYTENPTYPRVLIYDVLKALGYKTALFSSSNEYWHGMHNYLDTGNLDRFLHAANFDGPTYVIQSDSGFADWVRRTKHAGSINDRFTVDEALRWIDDLEKNAPFFLSITFQSSHLPYPVPPDFRRKFGPEKIDFKIRFGQFPRERAQTVKDIYADSLAYVDSQIARIVEHLKKRDRWDRTLIVLTSDHGQAFYEHGFAAHGGPLFNELVKVPLSIRAPGLPKGLEMRPAQHVDVAPTILGLLGLPPHPSFQGVNLFDRSSKPPRSVYMVAQTPLTHQYGIIRSGFKLIYDEIQQQYSLYDLNSDPAENFNVAASKPMLVRELSRRLLTWRKQQIDYYADETLHKREYPPIVAD